MIRRSKDQILRIGLPSGSLQDATVDLFKRAGYHISISSRSYTPEIDDPQISCVLFRAQEMSRYVEDGVIDLGITGHDWIMENESDVHEVAEMQYSKATNRPTKWVLAVPEESDIHKPEDLAGGVVATELMRTVDRYFKDKGVDVKVEFSWGATEVKARLVDAIVDITETGSSLRANQLRIIDTLMTSTTRLIANHEAWKDPVKRDKIESLHLLLRGAIDAKRRVGLKLNVPQEKVKEILGELPAEQSPTVCPLADSDWVAIEVIVEDHVERDLVPRLAKAGATGIISYPLNKVIH